MDQKNVSSHGDVSIADKFKLGKKWFWIGIAIALFNILSGLVFGIALMMEKKYRREGLIITLIAVAVAVATITWALINTNILVNAYRLQMGR